MIFQKIRNPEQQKFEFVLYIGRVGSAEDFADIVENKKEAAMKGIPEKGTPMCEGPGRNHPLRRL